MFLHFSITAVLLPIFANLLLAGYALFAPPAPQTIQATTPTPLPAVVIDTVNIQVRQMDGTPIPFVTAQVLQMTQARTERVAGECKTDANGVCALAFTLTKPIVADPRIVFPGMEFVNTGAEDGGRFFLYGPQNGQLWAFVLGVAGVDGAVLDTNPNGAPEAGFVTPTGVAWSTPITPAPVTSLTPRSTAANDTLQTPTPSPTPGSTPSPLAPVSAPNTSKKTDPLPIFLLAMSFGCFLLLVFLGTVAWSKRSK